MSQTIEIEQRFLVKTLPDLSKLEGQEMIDIYFPEITDHAHLRARYQKGKYEMTKKIREKQASNYVMIEQTIDLTKHEFDYFSEVSKRKIEKTRYNIPYENVTIELDVFMGKLKGLVIAEIEFAGVEDLENFSKPIWLGKEINNVEILAGGVLSGKTYQEIKTFL